MREYNFLYAAYPQEFVADGHKKAKCVSKKKASEISNHKAIKSVIAVQIFQTGTLVFP